MPKTTDDSTRQKVQQLLATGHTPREIAKELDLTTQAIYLQMEIIKDKAGGAS